jgi:formate-dependent nitrite reductase cytochrome c552 subunit
MAHSIHSFANCVGCHMPRIIRSAETGDLHSHAFVTLLPSETLKNKDMPNSCQTCHKHKNQDLNELQAQWEALAKIPKPVGKPIEPISYKPAPSKK